MSCPVTRTRLPPLRTAFEHVAHPQLSAHLLHIDGPTFIGETRVTSDYEQPRMRDNAVIISSTMPSAKYSCSGSPLKLSKGSTAIDGLSGSGEKAATKAVCFVSGRDIPEPVFGYS